MSDIPLHLVLIGAGLFVIVFTSITSIYLDSNKQPEQIKKEMFEDCLYQVRRSQPVTKELTVEMINACSNSVE